MQCTCRKCKEQFGFKADFPENLSCLNDIKITDNKEHRSFILTASAPLPKHADQCLVKEWKKYMGIDVK